MLSELEEQATKVGLNMNLHKIKVMTPGNTRITVKNTEIQNVKSYVYLANMITLGMANQKVEINRRKMPAWSAV